MNSHSRKLLIPVDQDPTASAAVATANPHDFSSPTSSIPPPRISSNVSSSSSAPMIKRQHPADHENGSNYYITNGAGNSINAYKLNPPLDSSMALTVLVLLTAFFFMGFFSIYIRRFADDNSADPSSLFRRRRRRRRFNALGLTAYAPSRGSGTRAAKGVDPATVQSLPVYRYDVWGKRLGTAASEEEEPLDCTICLSEFEEGESVKVIPSCGHVFHVDCIDTWLASHATCPLCRTEKIFPAKEEEDAAAAAENGAESSSVVDERTGSRCAGGGEGGSEPSERGLRATADGRDTWRVEVEEEEPMAMGGGDLGVTRSCSGCCSWAGGGERTGHLRRSLSI